MALKVPPPKNVYKKGYHVTEACVLTTSNHPVSIFSQIHSSQEKDYKSANTITFQAMEQGAALFKKATFAMDRGYDDNKMFLKMDELGQDYVIRLNRPTLLILWIAPFAANAVRKAVLVNCDPRSE